MAKEMTGLILILLVSLRCTRGRETLLSRRKSATNHHLRSEESIKDWIILLERLLGWHCWLCQPKISTKELHRAKKKFRCLLALFKKVAEWKTEMGYRLMKFHVVLHLIEDILNFGVPMVVDTGANESHHKSTKTAAKQTQKNKKRFEY